MSITKKCIFGMIKEVHVLPLKDLKKHNIGLICDCNPSFEQHENGFVAIHNSFDRREVDEIICSLIEDYVPENAGWSAICFDKTHHSN